MARAHGIGDCVGRLLAVWSMTSTMHGGRAKRASDVAAGAPPAMQPDASDESPQTAHIKSVVAVFDDFDMAAEVLTWALRYCVRDRAILHFISAVPIENLETGIVPVRHRKSLECAREHLLARCHAAGIRARIDVLSCGRFSSVADALRRIGPDLVIVGHKQSTFLQRLARVSLARYLMDRMPCPLLLAI